jgi:hypothetical protein
MKSKMQHHVQPREMVPSRQEQAQLEIQNFLQALDSYPARVEKEPGISFQKHLSSLLPAPVAAARSHRLRPGQSAKRRA